MSAEGPPSGPPLRGGSSFPRAVEGPFDPDRAELVALGDVGSTNDEALERLRANGRPLWVTAERQLAGRGRRRRTWVSEPGNLYASWAWQSEYAPFPSDAHSRQTNVMGMLPLAAAVALADALAELGLAPQLKWPNDVLIAGEKVAGILIETSVEAQRAGGPGVRRTVIGFGVNIVHHPTDSPATALSHHRPDLDRESVFQALRPSDR